MKILPDTPALMARFFAAGDKKRSPDQAPVFGVTVHENIPYIENGSEEDTLDVYYPDNTSQALPTILDMHGGAWVHGSKEVNKNYCMYLASQGFTVVNVNYTLAKNDDLCRQIQDLNQCMHWMLNNAYAYNMDIHTVFMCGDSSGAHLALLSYLVNTNPVLRALYKVEEAQLSVKAFGLCSPVADLHYFTDSLLPMKWDFSKRLFGDKFRSSPYFYCASIQDVLRTSTELPPVWMVSSEEDFFGRFSLQMDHLLTKRNKEHVFRYLQKGELNPLGHVFPVLYPEYSESMSINQEMIAYFKSKI